MPATHTDAPALCTACEEQEATTPSGHCASCMDDTETQCSSCNAVVTYADLNGLDECEACSTCPTCNEQTDNCECEQ